MKKMAFKSWMFWVLLGSGLACNLVLWVLVFTVFDRSNPVAVLHYSVNVGIDFVGEGSTVIVLPLIGSLLFILNTICGVALYRTEPRLSWVLWGIIPLIELTLLGSFLLLLPFNSVGNALNYPL